MKRVITILVLVFGYISCYGQVNYVLYPSLGEVSDFFRAKGDVMHGYIPTGFLVG